jgi:hypothetical protein
MLKRHVQGAARKEYHRQDKKCRSSFHVVFLTRDSASLNDYTKRRGGHRAEHFKNSMNGEWKIGNTGRFRSEVSLVFPDMTRPEARKMGTLTGRDSPESTIPAKRVAP